MLVDRNPPARPGADNGGMKVRVMLVDDQVMVVESLRRMFEGEPDIELHFVTDASAATRSALQFRPTVILQDLVMPRPDGFKLINEYRDNPVLRNVPVVVLSTNDDPVLKARCFTVGANDYLVKLPDKRELLARVRYHSSEYLRRVQRDEDFECLRESQSNLAHANVELQKLATLDSLTGLANRRRFDEVMAIEWQRCHRDKAPLSLLLCDIDCFKNCNDHFGHLPGDVVLQKTAAVLTAQLRRPGDLAARYGGEEFVLILPDTDLPGAQAVGKACCDQLAALAIDHPGAAREGIITMSVGVATVVPSGFRSMSDHLAMADKAMHAAKSQGRNCVVAAGER